MNTKIDGYEVLKEIALNTWQHHTFVKHINFIENNGILNIIWVDWQGNPLPFEPVQVEISGELIETITLILNEPELELTGEGQVVVRTLNENVQNAKVVVEL